MTEDERYDDEAKALATEIEQEEDDAPRNATELQRDIAENIDEDIPLPDGRAPGLIAKQERALKDINAKAQPTKAARKAQHKADMSEQDRELHQMRARAEAQLNLIAKAAQRKIQKAAVRIEEVAKRLEKENIQIHNQLKAMIGESDTRLQASLDGQMELIMQTVEEKVGQDEAIMRDLKGSAKAIQNFNKKLDVVVSQLAGAKSAADAALSGSQAARKEAREARQAVESLEKRLVVDNRGRVSMRKGK